MENEAILDYGMHNGSPYKALQKNPLASLKGHSIYEVIRIIDGIPLYLEEHIERLRKSAKLINQNINRSDKELIEDIYKLVDRNKEYNLNVKILCGNFQENNEDVYLYFMKSFYPPKDIYKKGINTILYKSERKNPHAKTLNKELRQGVNEKMKEKNAFEALLVNYNNQITEGSRSNVFFARDNILYTPPGSKVLLGVTRTKILELCKLNNIQVVERNISTLDLEGYDGGVITGTSVNVLPIRSIEDIILDSPDIDIIQRLINIYEEDISRYIKKK